MKRAFYLSIFILCLNISLLAQVNKKNSININAGFSLVGKLIEATESSSGDLTDFSLPAIQITFDHRVENWLSIGFAASLQHFGIESEYWSGYSGSYYENYKTTVNRINFAVRTLFHYDEFEKIDLYSGGRMGLTLWDFETNNLNPEYEESMDFLFGPGIYFAPQFVVFGMQVDLVENVGVNYEFCIGSPHYFSLGMTFKF